MELIPAIDLMDGNCVRLTEGDKDRKKIYSSSPKEVARQFEEEGASRLHLVDLDGAFEGRMKNLTTINEIIQNIRIPVQVGGGIRTHDTIDELIAFGVDRVILGTRAYKSPEFLDEVLAKYPEQIVVGVDAKQDKIATEGWVTVSETSTYKYVEDLVTRGVNKIILTDISKDGKLEGPNLNLLTDLLNFQVDIVISGGISSLEDVSDLASLKAPNLTGVILGTSLYEKCFTLSEALGVITEDGN